MKLVDVSVLLLGILSIVAGAQAYFFPSGDPSIISLIAGGTIGALLIGTVALAKTHPRYGRIGAAVLCILLVGNFFTKAAAGKIWPAAVMVVASLITLAILVGGHLAATRARKASQ